MRKEVGVVRDSTMETKSELPQGKHPVLAGPIEAALKKPFPGGTRKSGCFSRSSMLGSKQSRLTFLPAGAA